jgi:hypothetical protein
MSYRIHLVNSKGESFQILGNNEYADGLKEWIENEGGTVDEDLCFSHQIKDLDKLIDIFEKYIDTQDKWRSKKPFEVDIYNLRPNEENPIKKSLTTGMLMKIENGIIFVSAKTVLFFEKDIERQINFDNGKTSYKFKIKKGKKLYIRAG